MDYSESDDRAEVAGYTVVDPPSVVLHLTSNKTKCSHARSRQDVQALLKM